ncbi:hypothetical protein M422DRAFT_170099, partial [Sphaerobolus stellatus SS14]
SRISWWPLPHAWNKSGLDVGYWSAECETWYNTRLKRIAEGGVLLRTTAQWKKTLVRNRNMPKFMKNYREVCELALDSLDLHLVSEL